MKRGPRNLNRSIHMLVEELPPQGGELVLDATRSHHLLTVLRLESGQPLTVLDGRGRCARATLAAGGRHARLSCEEPTFQPPPALRLCAWLPVIRPERLEVAVEKLTELGVVTLRLYTSERTGNVRRPSDLARLRRVAEAAVEQSGNPWLPTIHQETPLDALMAQSTLPLLLAAQLGTSVRTMPPLPAEVAIVAGPEGGFSPTEESALAARAVAKVGLGPHILRTETAMIALAGLVQSHGAA